MTQDDINTYYHRRLARLERNCGFAPSVHPTQTNPDEIAAQDAVAKAAADAAAKTKAVSDARIAAEAATAALNAAADNGATITPNDVTAPASGATPK